jgi:hypothetical protein
MANARFDSVLAKRLSTFIRLSADSGSRQIISFPIAGDIVGLRTFCGELPTIRSRRLRMRWSALSTGHRCQDR